MPSCEFERLRSLVLGLKAGRSSYIYIQRSKQQVDFTAESIQNYVLSLGDLKGVSGSMAAISETLGGKMSN